ncbi:tautomerase family protein, partial [Bacillus mobilis]
DEKRTENILHVSITCGPGRTINQKKRLYQSISRAISNHLNISTTDIFIILNETSAENWSFGQGVAQLVNMREGKNSE